MSTQINASSRPSFIAALPFWSSLSLVPIALVGAVHGGWTLLLLPVCTWLIFSALDVVGGLDSSGMDPETAQEDLIWYRLITLIWMPIQLLLLFGVMIYVTASDHLHWAEQWALFATLGFVSGIIGVNFSHELMHRQGAAERWMADILLASVFYSHFRSEHLLVHHRYVGTPRDPVTARYNEHFWQFLPRVVWQCWRSAFRAEAAMQARKARPWYHISNPFLRYWALQAIFLWLAYSIAGVWGVHLLLTQAFWAVFHLELINYVEHYGLTRKHLGGGKYEHVRPHHSWNASQRVSNWMLINLQRHSDHHYKPDRHFPLLQTYDEETAPQLPFGYPIMGIMATIPSVWRRQMNPRVRAWRARHYPEIADWAPYKTASNPLPR